MICIVVSTLFRSHSCLWWKPWAAGLSPGSPPTVLVTFSKTRAPNLAFSFCFSFFKMALMLLILFYSSSAGHALILTMAICAPLGTTRSLTNAAGSLPRFGMHKFDESITQYTSQLLGQVRPRGKLWPYWGQGDFVDTVCSTKLSHNHKRTF